MGTIGLVMIIVEGMFIIFLGKLIVKMDDHIKHYRDAYREATGNPKALITVKGEKINVP